MPIPSLIDLVEQDRQRNRGFLDGATKIVVSGIKNAKERSDQRDKAKNRANRGVRAPRYNATAELQDALWNAGAFKGMKNRQGKELTYAQAVDGVNGNMTKQAIKKAKSMGYTVDENRGRVGKNISLTPGADSRDSKQSKKISVNGNTPKPVTSFGPNIPRQIIEQASVPVSNVVKNVTGTFINPFIPTSYLGSEEEARKLGYKTYGLTGNTVNYGVNPEDSTSVRSIADAQMKKYGITSQQAQDKSRYHKVLYEYMPTNGYDVFMMLEGMAKKDKNANSKTGRAVKGNKKRPISEAVERIAGKTYDIITGTNDGTALAENSKRLSRNASPKREDLRNLMMGYPIVNNTIEVAPFDEMGKGTFKDGFAYRFVDRSPLKNEAIPANLKPGEHRQIPDGENMGNHSISRSAEGNRRAYYDYWDINPFTIIPKVGKYVERFYPEGVIGRGFELYDRTE